MFKDLANYALDVASGLGATYADVRTVASKRQTIETDNLVLSSFIEDESFTVGVRVLHCGGWGFATARQLTKKGIENAVRLAIATAEASARTLKQPIVLLPEPVHVANWSSPCVIDPFSVPTSEKLAVLLDASKIMRKVKGISDVSGLLAFSRDVKTFLSTEGSNITQTFITTGLGIDASAYVDGELQTRSYPTSFGGQYEKGGFEVVTKWDLPGNAQSIAEEAVRLCKAPLCPTKTTDIILGSSQLGLQIHESCGHPTELDRALGQEINMAGASFLTPDRLNNFRYGSRHVNIVADATVPGALGSFAFDDEGVAGQRIQLVKNGIFCGYLSSRETAGLIGLNRSGGTMRAEFGWDMPIIRMTNVSIEPGKAGSLADLIADTKDGILFETNQSWSIDDMRYNFQFGTEVAWEIKNGRKRRMLRNPSYWGITPEFWGKMDAICGEEEYTYWGVPNCGKGQPMQGMHVGHGAAPARFRKVEVGAITDGSDSASRKRRHSVGGGCPCHGGRGFSRIGRRGLR